MSGDKSWDQPWTLQQMRDNAGNWSLAGDAGMLNYLVQFSQDVIERAQGTTATLDGMMADLEQTHSELSNVCNEFNLLAHSQFVENRVAEEDVETKATPSSASEQIPATSAEERVQEVIRNSLSFLDEMFEKVEVPVGSDSEDEEDSSPANSRRTQVILKAVNPYAERRLPHLIGSKEFEADDNVGLVFTPSDEEETEESPLAELHLARAQISESSSEAEVGANFSLPSDGEDDEIFSPKPPPLPQSQSQSLSQSLSFADELASKLGVAAVVPAQPQPAQPRVPARQSSQNFPPVDQREPPGLFGGEEDEAEDDWIFGSAGKGTFSGGKGLFDDTPEDHVKPAPVKSPAVMQEEEEDDEDNIFSTSVKPPAVKSAGNVGAEDLFRPAVKSAGNSGTASKVKDLFEDEEAEDDLFAKPQPSGKRKSSTLLFSDEEDLFAAPSRLHPGHPPNLEPKIPQRGQSSPKVMPRSQGSPADLFSEPDLQPKVQGSPKAMPRSQGSPKVTPRSPQVTPRSREESPKLEDTSNTKKLPAGAVSMFGGKSIFPASALRRQASTSSEESVEPSSVAKPQPSVAKSQDNSSVVKPEVPRAVARKAEPEVVKVKPASATKASIFDDNDSEEDLFSTVKIPTKSKPSEPPKATQKISLFGDSDEDELSPKISTKSQPKPNLFSESEPVKLFDEIDNNKTPIKSNIEQPKRKSSKSKNTIFNDSESEDDVLFSSASSGSSKSSKLFENAPKTATSTTRHGLFDDDWLFNAAPKTDSSSLFGETEDLFSSSKPEKKSSVKKSGASDILTKKPEDLFTEEKIESTTTKPEKKLRESDDLFAKSGNSDIFSTKPEDLFTEVPEENSVESDDLFSTTKPEEKKEKILPKSDNNVEKKSVDSDIFTTKPTDLYPEVKSEKKSDDLFSEKKSSESEDLFNKPVNKTIESDLFSTGIVSDELFSTEKQTDNLFDPMKKSTLEPIVTENILQTQTSNDSDDLFAEKHPKKTYQDSMNKPSAQVVETKKTNVSLFDSDEDDIFAPKTKKRENKTEKSTSDEQIVTKKNENIIINKTGTSTQNDIFSGNNDLFSENRTLKTDLFSTTPQDDLFADAVSSPLIEDDLFSSKPKAVTPQLTEKVEEIPTREEPPQKEVAQNDTVAAKVVRKEPPKSLDVPTAASLFSEVEEKSEDLFSGSSDQAEKPSVAPRQTSVLKPPSEPTVAKISPVQRGIGLNINPLALLPGQKSVKPYKQTSPKEEKPEFIPEIKKPEETKPEITPRSTDIKPPEIVSKSTPEVKTPEIVPTPEVIKPEITPRSSEPNKKPEVLPRSSEIISKTSELPEVEAPEARPRPVLKPLLITPQVVPEVKTSVTSPLEAAISFDDPTSATNLNFPNKDRIKIPHKRKASTRRGRVPTQNEPSPTTTTQSEPPIKAPVTTPSSLMAPPLIDREPPPLPPSNPMSPSTDEEDVFDLPPEYLDDEDSLFKPVPSSLSFDQPKPNISLFPDQTSPDNLFVANTDIFSTPTGNTDDLFSSENKNQLFSNDNLFPEKSDLFDTSSEKLEKSESSSDKLFNTSNLSTQNLKSENNSAISIVRESSSEEKVVLESTEVSSSILFPEENTTDIFDSSLKTDSSPKLFSTPETIETISPEIPEVKKSQNLFSEDILREPEEDLFRSSESSSKIAVQSQISGVKKSQDILKENSEDLFRSSESSSKSAVQSQISGVKKSQDILKETSDDLFRSSETSSKSTVPSQTSGVNKPTSSKVVADIFAEEEDEDIFASPAQPPMTKPTRPSPTPVPAPQPSKPQVVKTASKGLFSDSDDEDLFATATKSTPKSIPSGSKLTPKTKTTPKSNTKTTIKKDDEFEDPLMAFQQD